MRGVLCRAAIPDDRDRVGEQPLGVVAVEEVEACAPVGA